MSGKQPFYYVPFWTYLLFLNKYSLLLCILCFIFNCFLYSFKGREVRDKCQSNSLSLERYTPPDFVVKALQHTKVECTWDAGERHREKVLTNISMWKQLNESDLQQYVANSDSSDEEDDDEDEDDVEDGDKIKKPSNRKYVSIPRTISNN